MKFDIVCNLSFVKKNNEKNVVKELFGNDFLGYSLFN